MSFEGIGEDKTEVIWERIVNCYDQINQNEARKYNISVSHGIVVFEGKGKTHLDDLISEADEKMYQEKKIIKAGLNIIKENYIILSQSRHINFLHYIYNQSVKHIGYERKMTMKKIGKVFGVALLIMSFFYSS